MRSRRLAALGALCAAALVLSACGGGGGSSSTGRNGDTLMVGILTSLSGANSAAFAPTISGAQARLDAYAASSGKCSSTKIQLVKADDASGAQGALTASQKLIQQDKVYAILEDSSFFYGAAPFLTTAGKKTPVIGGAFDGAKQWNSTDNNLLPSGIVPDYSKVYSAGGQYLKKVGGTKVAGIAYVSPASQQGLESSLKSAEAAGLKRGYVNTTVQFGSTDVGAIVLGIIRSGSDVLTLGINPDTAFAVIAGLHQANYKLKAIISPTGYGADLLDSAPAVQAGQGVTFTTSWYPSEMKTPATETMTAALKKYAGSKSGIPGFTQAMGWLSADLLIHGLEKAGCDADQTKFLSTVRNDKTWDAGGLYPSKRDFKVASPDQQCSFYVTLKGTGFVPEPGATPLCGGTVKS
jgi:ABC-type branched-subunit amino acid transport system substrate-binding protein